MLAKPLGAVLGLIFGLIGVIPRPVEGRQRLGGDMGPPADAAIRRRRALLGESRSRREPEGDAKGDQRKCLDRRMFLKTGSFSNPCLLRKKRRSEDNALLHNVSVSGIPAPATVS